MGVGVGGGYPLSAVIASEFAQRRNRGHLMTTVFTAQGWGNFGTALTNPMCLNIGDAQVEIYHISA